MDLAIRTTLLAFAVVLMGGVASAQPGDDKPTTIEKGPTVEQAPPTGGVAQPTGDDRPPTGEERMAIQGALRNLGFSTWEEIEFDDGKWEIDDAVHSDGKKYDVQLEPGSLNLIKQEPDD